MFSTRIPKEAVIGGTWDFLGLAIAGSKPDLYPQALRTSGLRPLSYRVAKNKLVLSSSGGTPLNHSEDLAVISGYVPSLWRLLL